MLSVLMLVGCSGDISDNTDDTGTLAPPERQSTITLDTRDGVQLEADYVAALEEDRPGVVLLHMNPESNDRTNWPVSFINELSERNWSVVVPDRRGTGGSGGDAQDAFLGELGRYDVEACVQYLLDNGARNVSLVAASNGTTSALDYAAWAPGEGLAVPLSMAFLTGGNYTENNTEMTALSLEHLLFTYSTAEKAWSEMQQAVDPGTWQFNEYSDGDHGTRMFDAVPEFSEELEAWLATRLG